jgi:hypothetical protein
MSPTDNRPSNSQYPFSGDGENTQDLVDQDKDESSSGSGNDDFLGRAEEPPLHQPSLSDLEEQAAQEWQGKGPCQLAYEEKENCKELLFCMACRLKNGNHWIAEMDEEPYQQLKEAMVKRRLGKHLPNNNVVQYKAKVAR